MALALGCSKKGVKCQFWGKVSQQESSASPTPPQRRCWLIVICPGPAVPAGCLHGLTLSVHTPPPTSLLFLQRGEHAWRGGEGRRRHSLLPEVCNEADSSCHKRRTASGEMALSTSIPFAHHRRLHRKTGTRAYKKEIVPPRSRG